MQDRAPASLGMMQADSVQILLEEQKMTPAAVEIETNGVHFTR
jgi:hypothetical protein